MMAQVSRPANSSRILRMVFDHPGISRHELAARLELDRSTVSKIVSQFCETKLLLEDDPGDTGPRGGRRPIGLRLDPGYCLTVGIDIQADFSRLVLVDASGSVVHEETIFTCSSSPSLVTTCTNTIARAVSIAFEYKKIVAGIGFSIPGIVDSRRGTIVRSIALGITDDFCFDKPVSKSCHLPVSVENDARCALVGELVVRKNRTIDNCLYVQLIYHDSLEQNAPSARVSVGLAVVMDGKPYVGSTGMAGEFRSINWKPGNRNQFSLSDDELSLLTENPETVSRMLQELSNHIAVFANTLNLERVLVGGSEPLRNQLCAAISDAIYKNAVYPELSLCNVEPASNGERASATGAACIALYDCFDTLFQDFSLFLTTDDPSSVGRLSECTGGKR